MTSGFSGQAKEVRRDVVDSAREAARRAGVSVEEWLDAAIVESARKAGIEPSQPSDLDRRATRDDSANVQTRRRNEADEAPRPTARMSDVGARIDALSYRLNDFLQTVEPPARQRTAGFDDTPRLIADVISRLDRKIDRLIEDGRSANSEIERRVSAIDRAVTQLDRGAAERAPAAESSDSTIAEIEARRRALEDMPRAPTQRLPDLEQQLRQINARLENARSNSFESAIATLRAELAEIGAMIRDALPRESIEALESEVRALTARIDSERRAGVDNTAIAGTERGLAEVRDTLRTLPRSENLAGFNRIVQSLSQKIDQIAGASQDPATFTQIEKAIVVLRDAVSKVASNDAVQRLSEEVLALSKKIEQISTAPDGFSAIERQIATIADALQQSRATGAAPIDAAGLETVVKGIADKVDQLHASHTDQTALGGLEQRIMTALERLDSSEERLNQLGTIERSISDLQSQIKQQRLSAERADAGRTETEALKRDFQRTQDTLEKMHNTLGQVVDRLATIETGIRSNASPRAAEPAPNHPSIPVSASSTQSGYQPSPSAASAARANPHPAPPERRPIDPSLPPNHPLEPGAGRARGGASPADRIAASEAALENVRPGATSDPGGSSNFIAAARRAAQAATAEAPPRQPRALERESGPSAKGRFGERLRKLLLGAAVVVLALAGLHFAASQFWFATTPADNPHTTNSGAPSTTPTSPEHESTGSVLEQGTRTAALPPPTRPHSLPSAPVPASNTSPDRLPPSIGSTGLRTAANNGDPAAEFEVATRFADGRGVPQNLPEAVMWFERAAGRGLVPAQFRLGGLYEKGAGVPKNLDTARRHYHAAAEAGHAKAMHNLAVLYAEGIEGKPNYTIAARWFRRAAEHGVTDSQYNLAVLYARGIGVETNLAEAYKWFALAAREGDRDSAKRRDDLAMRLDKPSLAAAMAAVQAWQPQAQPAAVVEVSPPAGGWGDAPSASNTKRNSASEPQPPRPAQ